MDVRAFRDALGSFPTGVAVITAAPAADASNSEREAEAHIGITVNSFTSVSLDPPLVLWCMDRRSHRHAVFARATGFTVSILGTGHRDVSVRLARPGEHSLDGIALLETELGPPALAEFAGGVRMRHRADDRRGRPHDFPGPGLAIRAAVSFRAVDIFPRPL